MAENYFSKAIKLINKKLTITQMVENGLQAYVYPNDTIDYACKVLNSRELKLYLQLCGQADNFNGAMKFYCDKANIKSNHYSEILDSLEKKGFINHIKYESIEILFPTESAEVQKGNHAKEKNFTKIITIEELENNQKRNEENEKGNTTSQGCVYNKDIIINKEYNRENTILTINELPKKESLADLI